MKKGSYALISITACFVFLIAGIFLGRNAGRDGITVECSSAQSQQTAQTTTNDAFQSGKININTAGVDELVLLPNIGETIAQRIIAYRLTNGEFDTIAEITNVEGIGDGRFSEIAKYITVGGT